MTVSSLFLIWKSCQVTLLLTWLVLTLCPSMVWLSCCFFAGYQHWKHTSEEAEASVELSGLTNDELTVFWMIWVTSLQASTLSNPSRKLKVSLASLTIGLSLLLTPLRKPHKLAGNAVKGFAQRVAAGASARTCYCRSFCDQLRAYGEFHWQVSSLAIRLTPAKAA